MQSRIAEIRAIDAEVLAISADAVEKNRKTAERRGLDYTLLSDPQLEVIDAFGVRHPEGWIEGDIARPAVFILDREGRVVWRNLTENWRVRVRPETVLEVLGEIP